MPEAFATHKGASASLGSGGGVSEPVTQKELPRPREMSAGKQRGLCLDCRQSGSRLSLPHAAQSRAGWPHVLSVPIPSERPLRHVWLGRRGQVAAGRKCL